MTYEYDEQLTIYLGILSVKFMNREIDVDKYTRLSNKLDEWRGEAILKGRR